MLRVVRRADLAALWLPWCVGKTRRGEIIKIDHEPGRRSEAVQLRVEDIADREVRAALSGQVRDDGRSSLDAISDFADTFRQLASHGCVILGEAQMFPTREGLMLHDRCHRACALYEAAVEPFELYAHVHPLFDPWLVYDHPALRAGG